MSQSPERPRFSEIYRQQYRQVSSSKTSRAFRWITPVVLLAVAAMAAVLTHGHSTVLPIILGTGAPAQTSNALAA
jgi:hypothetical protein